jgi:hypothetical protein
MTMIQVSNRTRMTKQNNFKLKQFTIDSVISINLFSNLSLSDAFDLLTEYKTLNVFN